MRVYLSGNQAAATWLGPVVLGVFLILVGVLIFIVPNLVEYVIAALLILGGVSMIGFGWRMRSRTTFHRMGQWHSTEGFEDEFRQH